MKNLLTETTFQNLRILEKKDSGITRITGIASIVDSVNKNGRIYPRTIMEREISAMSEELSHSGRIGAVDHPESSPKVSDLGIRYTKLWMEDNAVMFEADILPTSRGKDLEALILAGVDVGISSRGSGSLSKKLIDGKEVSVVDADYRLNTFDAVTDPSVYDARAEKYEQYLKIRESLQEAHISEDVLASVVEKVCADFAQANKGNQMAEDKAPAQAEVAPNDVGSVGYVKVDQPVSVVPNTSTQNDPPPQESLPKTDHPADVPSVGVSTDAKPVQEDAEPLKWESRLAEMADSLVEAKSRNKVLESKIISMSEDAAALAALLVSLKDAVTSELNDNDWDDVAFLSNFAQSVAWKAEWDDYVSGVEVESKNKVTLPPVDEATNTFRSLFDEYRKAKLEAKISYKTREEQFSKPIAAALRESAKSVKDVDVLFPAIKEKVSAVMNNTQATGKAEVKEDAPIAKWTKEQREIRQNMGFDID